MAAVHGQILLETERACAASFLCSPYCLLGGGHVCLYWQLWGFLRSLSPKLPPVFLPSTQTHNLRGHRASSRVSSGLRAYLSGPRHTLSNRNSRQTSNITSDFLVNTFSSEILNVKLILIIYLSHYIWTVFKLSKLCVCVCVCVYKIFAVMYIFTLKPHFSLHQLHFNGLVATWGSEMVLESIVRDHQPQTFQSWELLMRAINNNSYKS